MSNSVITIYYLDGTVQVATGGIKTQDGVIHIYTQHNGTINIPLTSVKKYTVE